MSSLYFDILKIFLNYGSLRPTKEMSYHKKRLLIILYKYKDKKEVFLKLRMAID